MLKRYCGISAGQDKICTEADPPLTYDIGGTLKIILTSIMSRHICMHTLRSTTDGNVEGTLKII